MRKRRQTTLLHQLKTNVKTGLGESCRLRPDSLYEPQVLEPHAGRLVVSLAHDVVPESGGLAQTAAGRLQTGPVLQQHTLRVAVHAERWTHGGRGGPSVNATHATA